ncbi:MAG: helix-turn-helix transcriptional regulator [Nitrospinota bacterium]
MPAKEKLVKAKFVYAPNGKRPEYALIPYAEYRKLVERLEDLEDMAEVEAILADPDAGRAIPFEEVERRLFKNRIRAVRLKKRLTQAQLARKLRVSQSAVAQMEHPRSRPRLKTLQRAARALGVSVEELV